MTSSRPKRIEKAMILLRSGIPGPGGVWADVGCGDGIFTAALYRLIRPGGEIYGVDRSQHALRVLERDFRQSFPDASLHPVRADFTRPLALPPLDGLVMANSLHFVRDKSPVLNRLVGLLKPGGRLIVVEYNTTRSNLAVPHPLDRTGFLTLAREAGLRQAQIQAKIPSTFLGEMYAGLAFKSDAAGKGAI
jgi:ubiquinone/menaquinone biosynthesis C-methylase UbiE